jgi:PilZ domain
MRGNIGALTAGVRRLRSHVHHILGQASTLHQDTPQESTEPPIHTATPPETTEASTTCSPLTMGAPARGDVDLPVITLAAQEQKRATIVCPQCGQTKVFTLADVYPRHRLLKVKCPCGSRFVLAIEMRKYARKPVQLAGEYRCGTHRASMVVENLSKGGLGFRTEGPHALRVHEWIGVRFRLNDPLRSEVDIMVVVRRINGTFVGASFLDGKGYMAANNLLEAYLLV